MFKVYSPNMLKTYKLCPKKFYFKYIEKISVPMYTTPFEKGKKIHAIANYYIQGVKIDKLETALSSDEKFIWEKLLQNTYYNKECFKSEFVLSVKLKDFWLGGRIDAIVHDGDEFYIIDYKTGEIPKQPENDYQTMVYLMCLDKYLSNYNSLSFVYIDLKNDKNYKIDFSSKMRTVFEKDLEAICKTIESDSVFGCNNDSCKFCEYNKICLAKGYTN